MIELNHRKKLMAINLKDNYFAKSINQEDPGFDVVYYFHCSEKGPAAEVFNTIFVDLEQPEEDILNSFSKTNKKTIRSLLKSNEIQTSITDTPSDEDIEAFADFFDKFAKEKGIFRCDTNLLYNMKEISSLSIGKASYKGDILSFMVFIRNNERITGQYEASGRFFFAHDPEKVKMASKANRILEYMCMIHFKNRGFKIYDLGGVTLDPNDEEKSNIDMRKQGFGGEIVKEYHFMYPLTLKGRVFIYLKQISKRLKGNTD